MYSIYLYDNLEGKETRLQKTDKYLKLVHPKYLQNYTRKQLKCPQDTLNMTVTDLCSHSLELDHHRKLN